MQWLRSVFIISLILAVAACEPAFIADETANFSRQVGLIEDFDISRWHTRVFSRESRFMIYTSSENSSIKKAVNSSAENAFKHYFASADSSMASNLSKAKNDARQYGAHFIVLVELLSSEIDVDGNKLKEKGHKSSIIPEKVYETEGDPYSQVKLLMTIIAMNNEAIVDKVSLSADKLMKPYPGLNELLRAPLLAVAKELSGG